MNELDIWETYYRGWESASNPDAKNPHEANSDLWKEWDAGRADAIAARSTPGGMS